MLGIGFSEMILIAGIALVVIGPEKFPEFAKLVIRTVRDLRGYVDDVKSEVTKELKPIRKEMDSLSRIDPEKYIDSLTSGESDKKKSANPSVNEEDRKVMAAADAENYGEDPYGWEAGGADGYGVDKGAYPEETVGYGAKVDEEEVEESTAEGESLAEGESTEAPQPSEGPESAAEGPEDDRIEQFNAGDADDVWTGR